MCFATFVSNSLQLDLNEISLQQRIDSHTLSVKETAAISLYIKKLLSKNIFFFVVLKKKGKLCLDLFFKDKFCFSLNKKK